MVEPVADGLEIIDLTKKEDGSNNPIEIKLTNGKKVLVHEEEAYGDFYGDGRSFEQPEGNEDAEMLEFQFDFHVHKDGLKEMKSVGNTIHSNPMAVYHRNVLWTYAYGLSVVEMDEDGDLLCQFEMISLGPHFSKKPENIKGGVGNNTPPKQLPPNVKSISLNLQGKDEIEVPLVQRGDSFIAESLISISLLNGMMGQMPTVTIRIRLTIPISYFSLGSLIDLELKQPSTTPAAKKILTTILAGEKPPGFDWVISVADGSPGEYFVHRKVLADASPLLHVLLHTHSSLPNEQLLMVSHEDRFILTRTHAADMATILTYIYLRQFVLPAFDAFARIGRTLCAILPQDAIDEFFKHWEVAIVRDLITLSRKDFKKTIFSCVRHLISIYSTPYGALPVAKRVAIATMADTWQMAEHAGMNMEEELKNAEDLPKGLLDKILFSVGKFRTVVSGVRKIGL